MEWKTYTADESNYYLGATGILGEVVAICNELSETVQSTSEKNAIIEFMGEFITRRSKLRIADKKAVNLVYTEVKPLIDRGKLTVDYILQHSHYVCAV